MAQNAKFIDITRTFIPVDPNSFPESLHTSGREDAPEHASPVMAYKGYNFLPTSYGYKSYFGTNQLVGIDALPAKADYVFIYQNLAYENVLIALCDTGIWTKMGSAAGAWVNSVPIALPIELDTHFEWTYTIVANILYAYQQGQLSYQKIISAVPAGVTITSVTPNFLNMGAQLGIFRANGRLAFWDSDDSISWANLDDFADFEPSLETLAGNVKFSAVQGRIVTILSHGPGFMVYSTRSIVYVAQDIANLFQWNPMPVLPSIGISYPRQVAVGSPDTLHFAYTQEGIKKIDHAKEDTVVTEVTDFLKNNASPIYLRIVGGRFLFIELLDKDSVVGTVQLSIEDIPPTDYVFPGADYTLEGNPPVDMGAGVCSVFSGINNGTFTDTQPPAPNDRKVGTPLPEPVWTCYLSKNGIVDVDNIIWGAAPCPTLKSDGTEANMCPTNGPDITKMTQDSTHKVAVTGAQAYIDGHWTIERFIQTQNAIWELENKALEGYVKAVLGRSAFSSQTGQTASCTIAPPSKSNCVMSRLATEFSEPVFGWSKCSFWLTRYATKVVDLVRVKRDMNGCVDTQFARPKTGYYRIQNGVKLLPPAYPIYGSASAAIAVIDYGGIPATPYGNKVVAAGTIFPTISGTVAGLAHTDIVVWATGEGGALVSGPGGGMGAGMVWYDTTTAITNTGVGAGTSDGSSITVEPTVTGYETAGRYTYSSSMSARNEAVDVDMVPVPESPYCEITGWTYTKEDGTEGFIAATGVCEAPSLFPTTSKPTPMGAITKPPIDPATGSICGHSFESALVSDIVVNWPSTNVTIPASSFLLQKGSIAPMYPTFEGALVYDLQLKKWGKMKLRYKQLVDYSPVNSTSQGLVPTSIFGIMSGVLRSDGKIGLFDMYPTESYISYGKVGYDRRGNTTPEEVRVDFRVPCTGYVKVETSLHGQALSNGFEKTELFTNATAVTLYGAYPGRWSNIEIGGIFDISYLEYTGYKQGRR